MNIEQLRNEIAIRTKNGLAFLLAANITWFLIYLLLNQSSDIYNKNVLIFYASGILLPLAVLISKIIKSDFNTNDHPLGILGLILNFAQIIYFPLVAWAFIKSPVQMVMFLAVITGAHLFPYGWLYKSIGYYVMSIIMSVSVVVIGWNLDINNIWYVPLLMVALIFILNIWLFIDYKYKIKTK